MRMCLLVSIIGLTAVLGPPRSYADIKGEQLLRRAETIARRINTLQAQITEKGANTDSAVIRLMKPGLVYFASSDDKGNTNVIVTQGRRLLNVDGASHSGSAMDYEDLYNVANFVPFALYITCSLEPSQYRSFVNPTYVGTRKLHQTTYQVVTCPPSYGRGATTFYIGASGLPEGITVAAVKQTGATFPAQEFWIRDLRLNVSLTAGQFAYATTPTVHIEEQENPIFQFLHPGDKAPEFVLNTPAGKRLSLASLRKGNRAVLLNFTFAECGACIQELPVLKQLYQQTKAKGLACVAINLLDDKDNANRFLAKYRLTYPMGLDSAKGGGSSEVSKGYRVDMGGVNYLISGDGRVLWRYAGMNEVRLRCVLEENHIHAFTPAEDGTGHHQIGKHTVQKPGVR